MANPQPDQFTRISNEIMEQMAKTPLNGTQRRIIDVVMRFTYGFSRKEHELSLTFFMTAMDMKKTQIKQVKRELDKLIEMKILLEAKKPTKNTTRVLSFNKDYEQWSNNTSGLIRPVVGLDQSRVDYLDHSPVVGLDQQERNIKETLKKDMSDQLFDELWILYRKKEGKSSVKATKRKEILKIGKEEMTRAIERYNKKLDDDGTDYKYIKMGSTFFNGGYMDYLDKNYAEAPKATQSRYQSVEDYEYGR